MGLYHLNGEVDPRPTSALSFTSSPSNDADRDGCEDNGEDLDDDNDGARWTTTARW